MRIVSDEKGIAIVFENLVDLERHVGNLKDLLDNAKSDYLPLGPYIYTIIADRVLDEVAHNEMLHLLKNNKLFDFESVENKS